MRKYYSLILGLLLSIGVIAQPAPPSNLSGSTLRTWLKTNWYDGRHTTLSYSTARMRMYNNIDNQSTGPLANTLTCVYSGYSQAQTFGGTNTNPTPINCEHTVPQSFFNSNAPMVSDIHHLFPVYDNWNSTRSNFQFKEIADADVTKWMINSTSQTTAPAMVDRPNYARFTSVGGSFFQPRNVHKGNLARAIFYFYTMYPTVGAVTDVAPLQTLYDWHLADPVDAAEIERNKRVASYQGTRNPYIDYPEIVATAWGFATCSGTPTVQVSGLSTSNLTANTVRLNFTGGNGDQRIVVARATSSVNLTLSGTYSTGVNTNFTTANDQGSGNKVLYVGSLTQVDVTGLNPNTNYFFRVNELCSSSGPTYNTTSPQTISITTPSCSGNPSVNSNTLTATTASATSINLNWNRGSGTRCFVVARASSAVSFTPTSGTALSGTISSNFGTATDQGSGNKIVYDGTGASVSVTNLSANTQYFFRVYEYCDAASPGPYFLTTGMPEANATTPLDCSSPPNTQVSGLTISSPTASSLNISFTNGNGNSRVVVMRAGSAVSFTPTNGTTYTGNNDFSAATDQGSGNKIVSVSSSNSLIVTGLTQSSTYFVQVFEACNTQYNTTSAPTGGGSTTGGKDLIISEYVEGSSNNKAIEIFNGTGRDLSLSGYSIRIYTNGATTPSIINLTSTATLNDGETFVIANSSANTAILALAQQTSGSLGFNGNDAVALFNGTSMIDLIGKTGCDPGTAWTTGSLSTLDKTLKKKAIFCSGITTSPTATCNSSSFTTLATQWDVYNVDDISGLGNHTADCGGVIATTGTISGSPFCVTATSGTSITIPYTITGALGITNQLTAQLSDASGSFASPISIGSLTTTATSGNISGTIPAGTANGSGYRVRILTSDPVSTGASNTANLTVGTGPVNVTSFSASNGNNQSILTWTNPTVCFTEIIIIARAANAVSATLTGNGSLYTANNTFGGSPSGNNLPSGEFCVYKGSAATATITGLTNGETYYFKVFTRLNTSYSAGTEVTAVPFNPSAGIWYRSRATGNWNAIATWERSTNSGTSWANATTGQIPSDVNSDRIIIKSGTTVTQGTSVTLDQTIIESGGIMVRSGDMSSIALNISNGVGDDLVIEGTYRFSPGSGTTSGLPICASGVIIRVKNGAVVEVTSTTGGKGDAHANNETGGNLKDNIRWENGSIFFWNVNGAPSANGIVFFPQESLVGNALVTLRVSATQGTAWGGGSASVYNCKLELLGTFTLGGAGNKILKYGVTGAGTLVSNSTSATIFISKPNSELSANIQLNASTQSLIIDSGATVSMANSINWNNGILNVQGSSTLDMGDFSINRLTNNFNFTLNANSTVRTRNTNGISGINGGTKAINTTGTQTFSGTVDHYREGAQAIDGITYGNLLLSGSGLKTLSGNVTATTCTLQNAAILTASAARTLTIATDGSLYISGTGGMADATLDNLTLTCGGGNQTISALSQVVKCNRFSITKASGTTTLGSNTILSVKGDFELSLSSTGGFNYGGNQIRVGDDFRITRTGTGTFTNNGTVILNGLSNDATCLVENMAASGPPQMPFNNLVIDVPNNIGSNISFTGSNGKVYIDGNLSIPSMGTGAIQLGSNDYHLKGDLSLDVPSSITWSTASLVCDGINPQNLTSTGALTLGKTEFRNNSVKSFGADVTFNDSLKLANQAIFTLGDRTYYLKGSGLANTSASISQGTSTFFMDASGAQNLEGDANIWKFNDLIIGGSGTKSISANSSITDSLGIIGTATLGLDASVNLTIGGNLSAYGRDGLSMGTSSTLTFNGAALQLLNIPGAWPTLVNISLAKTGTGNNGILRLKNSCFASGTITATNGILETDTSMIVSTATGTISENQTNQSYVKGVVRYIRSAAQGVNQTFGSLGVQINAADAAPGSTTVTRTIGYTITALGGYTSVQRHYRIVPATNTGLNATVVFSYYENELNGIPESRLTLFRSTNSGMTWLRAGGTVNTTANTITVNNVDGFSLWTIGDDDAPLPVELMIFKGQVQGKTAMLEWTTASEANNLGFEVQKSTDGKSFKKIGFVDGLGYSTYRHTYYFTDEDFNQKAYYRLRQLDNDGNDEFSEKLFVTSEISPVFKAEVYPNPVQRGFAALKLYGLENSNSAVEFTLQDSQGRSLSHFNGSAEKAQIWLNTQIINCASGFYLLKTLHPELGTYTHKFSIK